MQKIKGVCLVVLSALLFGFTPILGKMTYTEGSNAVTLLFLRAVLALPILLGYLCIRKISLRVSGRELFELLFLSAVGSYATTLLLYSSYSYLSVGLSTTLHFIYPMVTVMCTRVLFREKLSYAKIVAAVLSLVGVFLSAEITSGTSALGAAYALLSGCTYAFYIVLLDHTRLKNMHFMKLAFYQCLISSLCVGLINGSQGELQMILTVKGYVLSALVAILVSVVAIPAFQVGVKLSGGMTAALLSTFEPVTSILCGILLLNERLTYMKLMGCTLILIAIILSPSQNKTMQERKEMR